MGNIQKLSAFSTLPVSPVSQVQAPTAPTPGSPQTAPQATRSASRSSAQNTLLSGDSITRLESGLEQIAPRQLQVRASQLAQVAPDQLKQAQPGKAVEEAIQGARQAQSYNEALEQLQTGMTALGKLVDARYGSREAHGDKLLLRGNDIAHDSQLSRLIGQFVQVAETRHASRELQQMARELGIPLNPGLGGQDLSFQMNLPHALGGGTATMLISDDFVQHACDQHVNLTPRESLEQNKGIFSHEFLPRNHQLGPNLQHIAATVIQHGAWGEIHDSAATGQYYDVYLNFSQGSQRVITGWQMDTLESGTKGTGDFYKGVTVRGKFNEDFTQFRVETMFPTGRHKDQRAQFELS